MMKMLRTALLATLFLTLTACGGEKTVHFGAVLPVTGDSSIYGVPVRNGAELAFEQAQASGEYPFVLELQVEDSGSDPVRAKELLRTLYDGGSLAVMGGVTSAEALEMVSVADEYDRVLLSPTASNPSLTKVSENFYRVFPSDFVEGTKAANFATQKLELETVVILAAESLYGRGVQEIFKTEFERYGGKVVEVIEYPENTVDFSGLMERVVTLKPQGAYLADFAGPIGSMIKSLRKAGFRGKILTTSAFASPKILDAVGADGEGVMLTQPTFDANSEDGEIPQFVEAYEAKYGVRPGLFAAHGYDAMRVLLEAARKAPDPVPSEYWKGMRSVRDFPGVTGTLQFDDWGDVQKLPRVYILADGGLRDYDLYVEAKRREIMEKMKRLNRTNG